MLDALIPKISSDTAIQLGRNTPSTMRDVKIVEIQPLMIAHISRQSSDLDDIRLRYRHMIQEILSKAGIMSKK